MASAQRPADNDDQLTQDFDNHLPRYLLNEARILKAVAEARQLYERTVLGTTPAVDICVRPEDLVAAHDRALRAAIYAFIENTKPPTTVDESETDKFTTSLGHKYVELEELNNQNNKEAIEQARKLYRSKVQGSHPEALCTTKQKLEEFHVTAQNRAFDMFKSKRTPYIDYSEDSYRTLFHETINDEYEKIKWLNDDNNRDSIKRALQAYEAEMKTACAPTLPCLHPEDLEFEHGLAKDLAVDVFNENRDCDPQDDDYKEELLQELAESFKQFESLNEALNSAAVLEAYQEFIRQVQDLVSCAEILINYMSPVTLVVPFVGYVGSLATAKTIQYKQIPHYESAKDAAFALLKDKRRSKRKHKNTDHHCLKLVQLMKIYTAKASPWHWREIKWS